MVSTKRGIQNVRPRCATDSLFLAVWVDDVIREQSDGMGRVVGLCAPSIPRLLARIK